MLISREARNKYSFNEFLFQPDGHFSPRDYHATGQFAEVMSKSRGTPVSPSDIHAMYLLDYVFRFLMDRYTSQNPFIIASAFEYLHSHLGIKTNQVILKYTDEFPSLEVYTGRFSPEEYLSRNDKEGEKSLKNLIMADSSYMNPAFEVYK